MNTVCGGRGYRQESIDDPTADGTRGLLRARSCPRPSLTLRPQASHARRRLIACRPSWIAGLALAFCLCGPRPLLFAEADLDPDPVRAGPLYHRFRLTLEPGERTEVLGPLGYEQRVWEAMPAEVGLLDLPAEPSAVQDAATTLAFPPLFSLLKRPPVDALSWDFLYPLVTYDRYGKEYRLQFGQLLSFSGGQSQAGTESRGFSLFPLLFFRRSADPAQNYSAVLPFYGHFEKHLFRDEIRVVLWPLYAQTRTKDVVTDNYLVPFFHLRHGDGLKGWQFWPLVGREHKDITTKIDAFGDVRTIPGQDSLFVLWPLFFRNDADVGTTNQIRQRVLLPLYSMQLSPAKDSRSYLWPLGPTFVEDRAEGYHQVGAPWPLIVFARGQSRTIDRVFPLFSHMQYRDAETTWYLWPLYWHREVRTESLHRDMTRIAFFLYTDIKDRDASTQRTSHRTDFWPLFAARRDFDGTERFQLFAPLEPILTQNPSVARNWSPLWAIWRAEKNAKTGAHSRSFLWNLYRYEAAPGARKCSLLFGLIQYDTGLQGSRWRWLYFLGGKKPRGGEPVKPASVP